jgi:hypothetical protein
MADRVQGPASYFPSIEKKHGKPIGYRLDLVRASELTKHKALADRLKADFGLGDGHATAIADHVLAERAADGPRQAGHPPQARTETTPEGTDPE